VADSVDTNPVVRRNVDQSETLVGDRNRLESLAAILARAVLRLRQRDRRSIALPAESAADRLALCSDSRPPVVDASQRRQKEAT